MRLFLLILTFFILSGCTPKSPLVPQNKCITSEQLSGYSYDYLSQVAVLMREDSRKIDDFSVFINTLKLSVNNYSSMIKSSTYLTNAVRFLPIPYAGEISNFTKVFTNSLLHLNSAAVSLDNYKKSSSAFLDSFNKLDKTTATPEQLAKLSAYADTTVMADARDLRISLQKISSSVSALAATAQSISNAMETTEGYFTQAKSFVGLKPEATDKVKVNESSNSLNTRISQLSQKITSLEHSSDTHRQNIAKARTYAELAVQVEKQ
jgi:hypothetical protein